MGAADIETRGEPPTDAAASPEAWAAYRAEWVDVPEEEYQRKVREGR